MTTSCSPVVDAPCPMIRAPLVKDPANSVQIGPIASAMDPARSSVDAVARLLTDAGQKAKLGGNSSCFVIAGRPTVTRPLMTLPMSVIPHSWMMAMTCWRRKTRGAGCWEWIEAALGARLLSLFSFEFTRCSSIDSRGAAVVMVVDMAVVVEAHDQLGIPRGQEQHFNKGRNGAFSLWRCQGALGKED